MPAMLGNQPDVIASFSEIFQHNRVDILMNNAGISHIGNAENTPEADFDRVLRVNVKGFYNCIHAIVGHMKSKGGGVILNMASIAGSAGLADRFVYSTSKGAVIAMTYSVARDYLPFNVRCNCISPGRVHTPFVDGFLRNIIPGASKRCMTSWQRPNRLDEWPSLARSLHWHYFYAQIPPRILRALTI